jgi:hypothetical protein
MDPAERGNVEEVQSLKILRGETLAIGALASGKPECG